MLRYKVPIYEMKNEFFLRHDCSLHWCKLCVPNCWQCIAKSMDHLDHWNYKLCIPKYGHLQVPLSNFYLTFIQWKHGSADTIYKQQRDVSVWNADSFERYCDWKLHVSGDVYPL